MREGEIRTDGWTEGPGDSYIYTLKLNSNSIHVQLFVRHLLSSGKFSISLSPLPT